MRKNICLSEKNHSPKSKDIVIFNLQPHHTSFFFTVKLSFLVVITKFSENCIRTTSHAKSQRTTVETTTLLEKRHN